MMLAPLNNSFHPMDHYNILQYIWFQFSLVVTAFCIWGECQVILHQVTTGEQGKKYCETLSAPFEHHDSEFSVGVLIEKRNIDSLNLSCHKVCIHIIKA